MQNHTDTKLTTLVFNALSFAAQHYYKECKSLMANNTTLPHTDMLNGPGQTSTFPCTVYQALALYPRVQTKCKELLEELLDGRHFSQFTRLGKLLSGYSTPVAAEPGQTPKTANNFSFQVESKI